jgi:hypothetical protein
MKPESCFKMNSCLQLRLRHKEKASRATTEQVIDPRTRMILYKMLNNNLISEIHGCISTGKEVGMLFSVMFNCIFRRMFTSLLRKTGSKWQSKFTRPPFWFLRIVSVMLLVSLDLEKVDNTAAPILMERVL